MKSFFSILIFLTVQSVFSQTETKDIFDVARNGTVEELKSFEESNPKIVDSLNQSGFSPLILACYRGNREVAEYLMDKANVNYISPSGTALAAVVVKGDTELALKLLEKKADPDLADPNGATPLMFAVQFQNERLAELLLKFGADKTLADKNGKTAFEYAVFTKNPKIIELLKNQQQ